MNPIPVAADEPRSQELAAELILARSGQGVVEEEGVTDRLVDDAVEDVREDLALGAY